jgi:hypothetical protein
MMGSGVNYRPVSAEVARSNTVANGFGCLQRDVPPRGRTPPRTPPRESRTPPRGGSITRYRDPNLGALRHDVLARSDSDVALADRRAVSSNGNMPSQRRKQQANYDALGVAPLEAHRDLRFPQSAAHRAKFAAELANGAAHYINHPNHSAPTSQPQEHAQWVRPQSAVEALGARPSLCLAGGRHAGLAVGEGYAAIARADMQGLERAAHRPSYRRRTPYSAIAGDAHAPPRFASQRCMLDWCAAMCTGLGCPASARRVE